jgi:AsmA protein
VKILKKIIAYGLFGFLIIAITLALYFKFSFDPNVFKAEIIKIVKDQKQRDLVLTGPIKLEFLPNLGIRLEEIQLSAYKSKEQFARAEKAHVSLKILPLIKRQIVIDELNVENLSLYIERKRDGLSNLDDLIQSKQSSLSSKHFEIQSIQLKNAHIDINDEASGTVAKLTKLNLKTGRISTRVKSELELDAQVSLQKKGIRSSHFFVLLRNQFSFDLDNQSLTLEKNSLNIKGDFAGHKSLLTLTLPNFSIENKGAKLNFQTLEAKLESQLTPQQPYVVNLRLPEIHFENSILSGSDVFLQISGSGDGRNEATLNVKKILGKLNKVRLSEFQIDYSKSNKEQKIDANIKSTLTVDLLKSSIETSPWSGRVQIKKSSKNETLIDASLEGEAQVSLAAQTAQVKINSKFDETLVKADVQINMAKELQVYLDAQVSKLNLDRYLKTVDSNNVAAVSNSTQVEQAFDLSALKTLNLTGQLRIDELQVKQIHVSNFFMPIRLQHGFFESQGLSAQLYDGAMQGKLSINAHDAVFSSQQNFKQMNISPLLKNVLEKDVLEGRGDLNFNLRSQGLKLSTLKQNLSGNVRLSLNDGAIKGINLAKSLRDFKSRILSSNDMQQSANILEKTDFSSLTASIDFAKGIGSSHDLSMMSPFLRVTGSGQVDLPKSSLDYIAKTTIVNTSTGQEGKQLSELKDISIPVHIYGPFDRLNYQLQFTKISSEALKSSVKAKAEPLIEEKKKELKGKLNDELKSKLKGLFEKN